MYSPLSILLKVHSLSVAAIGSKIAIFPDDKVESTPESIVGTFGATGHSNEIAFGSKDAFERPMTAEKQRIVKFDNIIFLTKQMIPLID